MILISQSSIENISWRVVVSNLGATVGLIGLVQFLYDCFVRRAFFGEIISTIISCTSVRDSGIERFYSNSRDINYAEHIKKSSRISILIAHSPHIINHYIEEFQEHIRKEKELELVHINASGAVIEYLEKVGIQKSTILADLAKIKELLKTEKKNKISIKTIDFLPKYSALLFDDRDLFLILHPTSKGKRAVPCLHIKSGTPLFTFFSSDFDTIKKEATNG